MNMPAFVHTLEVAARSRRVPPRLRRSLHALAELRRGTEAELSFDEARLVGLLPRVVTFGSDEAIGLAVAISKRLLER